MIRNVLACLLCLFISTNRVEALTVADAQVCANKILRAYNKKTYPGTSLAVEDITSRAYGVLYRALLPKMKKVADDVALKLLQSSFTEPSGLYKYKDLIVEYVEPTDKGYRALGEVYIISPKYSGPASFTALLKKSGCKVYQVRIAEIYALDIQLRDMLTKDERTRKFFED